MVSIKFRPTKPGAVYQDEFNFKFADAYMYASEYAAAAKGVVLRDAPSELKAVGAGSKVMAMNVGTERHVLWIQHETGLEILADYEFLLSLIQTILALYEIIRNEININKSKKRSDQETDRLYGPVDMLRVEKRDFCSEGNLRSETVVSISIHKGAAELRQLLLAALSPVKLSQKGCSS